MARKKREERRAKIEKSDSVLQNCGTNVVGMERQHFSSIFLIPASILTIALFISGCATPVKKAVADPEPGETRADQADAASKVIGAMAGKEMTEAEMKQVVKDVRKNREARSAVQKIIGAGEVPAIKYSPATGKHYSGDLEYDPETGVKLEVIEE